jgi:hypothetical protein
LTRAALELPYPADTVVVLVRSPAGAMAIDVKLLRDEDEAEPDVIATGIGAYALHFGAGEKSPIRLRLSRPEDLPPARATSVKLSVLVPEADGKVPRLVTNDIELPATGKPVTLRWNGSAFGPP